MSVTGFCEICERPSVEHTCDRCGRLVCDRHWDTDLGVCVECVAEVGNPDETVDQKNLPDGVDTYRY